MESHGRGRDDPKRLFIHLAQVARGRAGIDENALAALVRSTQTMKHLVARRLIEEGLVGVQIDGRIGVAKLIRVLVRGVVGAEILDAPKVRAADGETTPLKAKVVWQNNNRNFCRVGLKFVSPIRGTWVQRNVDDIAGHPKQKRRHIRVRTDWTVEGRAGIETFEARMRDISITGCHVETKASLIVGQQLRLKLGNLEVAADVRRVSGLSGVNLVGLRFESQEPQTGQLVALVKKLTGG